MILMVDICPT